MDEVRRWTARDVIRVLRMPTARDDKYSRGVLGIRTGSADYPGAAVLGVEAAWRTGIGMVRYTGPAREAVLARRPETVCVSGRVHAWVIGSGTDAASRPAAETEALRGILSGTAPVVVDAGALDLAKGATGPLVVTPHAGEHARLRAEMGLGEVDHTDPAARVAGASETARALGAVVVLKGSHTLVADPTGAVRGIGDTTPWLATAGTGDVLAGVIGALVASAVAGGAHTDPDELAALAASGVWLHAGAGALAAGALGSQGGPITASDVAAHLPRAVADVLASD
jgi:hydroxyethylthiazole kinase-like uncharacterized protein yjeF